MRKIEEAIFQLDDPLNPGNQSASPEYVLAQAEKFSACSG
jgi:hypothetical protein